MSQNGKQENLLKTLGIVALALVVLVLLNNVLFVRQPGYGMHYSTGYGLGFNGLLATVFALAVKLLWFVFVISLVVGTVLFIKKYLFDDKKINLKFLEEIYETDPACPACGTKLKAEYRFCPGCGAEKNAVNNISGGTEETGKTDSGKTGEGVKTDG